MMKTLPKFQSSNTNLEQVDVKDLIEKSDIPALLSQIETMKQFQTKSTNFDQVPNQTSFNQIHQISFDQNPFNQILNQ